RVVAKRTPAPQASHHKFRAVGALVIGITWARAPVGRRAGSSRSLITGRLPRHALLQGGHDGRRSEPEAPPNPHHRDQPLAGPAAEYLGMAVEEAGHLGGVHCGIAL